jgi:hypothetical protein
MLRDSPLQFIIIVKSGVELVAYGIEHTDDALDNDEHAIKMTKLIYFKTIKYPYDALNKAYKM